MNGGFHIGRRWIRLLFGREFPLDELIEVWDCLFAEDPGLQLVDYICVAMLLRIRWQRMLSPVLYPSVPIFPEYLYLSCSIFLYFYITRIPLSLLFYIPRVQSTSLASTRTSIYMSMISLTPRPTSRNRRLLHRPHPRPALPVPLRRPPAAHLRRRRPAPAL